MKSILLVMCLVFTSAAIAAGKAKVVMVRGKATKLLPNSKKATPVKKGEMLPEDTSVVTAEKSIVRLRFEDKSSVNIGPNSKLIVAKMEKKKANMLNLLTGAIKSEVDKREQKEKSKNKMIVKTRSAVMGVRGTKFQATYNPVNKNTSLVTVEGKVAMVKRAELPPKVIEKPVESVATDSGIDSATNVVEKVEVVQTPDEELAQLDKALDTSTEAVEVTEGNYSGVAETTSGPTKPVKIAPKQYDALAKSMDSTKTAEEVMKVSDGQAITEVAANAPRPGGYVDFQTGLYVAPPEDSVLDEKTGTYDSKEIIGSVDEVTGDYVPPEGVELDAKKGFVIKEEELEKVASADKEKLQETIAKFNDDVKKQVVVNKMEDSTSNDRPWYKPKNHLLGVTFIPYSDYMTVKNKDRNAEAEFYSQSANKIYINWGQSWSDKITTIISIGANNLAWEKPDEAQLYENGEDGSFFRIGADYKWSERLTLNASIIDQTVFYVVSDFRGGNSLSSFKNEVSHLDFSFNYFLYDWKMFSVNVNAGIKMFMNPKLHAFESSAEADASGFYLGMNGRMDWSKALALEVGGWIDRSVYDVPGITFTKIQFGTTANLVYKL